ncbi:MAG: hypothetical protein PHQ80_04685 [Candidatus ainarchaeum sp.]|nr:hypothetical protein [Candidatus ainarchaeum sp.]MDD5096710.1 hypothetical protein [Candidatus ainarchaeum sp.]
MYEVRLITPEEKEKEVSRIYAKPLFEKKADIYGTCIKLFTDNEDYYRMWCESFSPMAEEVRPHGRVIAVSGEKLEILYEWSSKTVIVKGCDYYGWVKSIALALVAEFLEDFSSEHRRYSVHGSYVDFSGRGVGIMGPPGSGKTTLTYGLLLDKDASFLTDDWFFVRVGNDVSVFSAEKNSYIRGNIEEDWKEYKGIFAKVPLRYDNKERAVADVKMLFGEEKIKENSVMRAAVILTREPGKPPFREVKPGEALAFLQKNDFCNPHQLVRDRTKRDVRAAFFKGMLSKMPVYILNTVEKPAESLKRLEEITKKL